MIAFTTNAVAQWNNPEQEDLSTFKEYHWFGLNEYIDQTGGFGGDGNGYRRINWSEDGSGNYIESIEIKYNWHATYPKTSFYSWLDHKLRFSVDSQDKDAWIIGDANNGNGDYNDAYSRGQGLKNESGSAKNFYVHNLNAGDQVYIRYYGSFDDVATELDSKNGQITISGGTATISIPAYAVIRNVVITTAYVASDFKVEEVKGPKVKNITDSYKSFLQNQGITDAQFGDIGYRYSFKGPGVLEDKRGAAPYITMKFGNDNDMTFVRALNEVTYTWGDLKKVTPKMFTKNGIAGGEDGPITESNLTNVNGEDVYVITSVDRQETGEYDQNNNPIYDVDEWDTQFWIGTTEYSLPAGQKFKIKFDYKADNAATAHTQTHLSNPGEYKHWACIGDLNFTTDWKPFEQEITLTNDMDGWQYVAFNLNVSTSANTYYFKNIELQISEKVENINSDDLAAASIIHGSNYLNPGAPTSEEDGYLQYQWTFKDNNQSVYFTEDEIRDQFIGKEWSTFTAQHDYLSAGISGRTVNGRLVGVFGDKFDTIWPLCGNFFYFFPEVNGMLEIEYYCEGSAESAAFWYKQREDGSYPHEGQQPNTQFLKKDNNGNWTSGNWDTNGNNHYKLRVNVEKGGIYYFCSLPTNLQHRPIVRLKSYTFVPTFRVAPLYKVVKNTEVNTDATLKVAEIKGGPYTDLNGLGTGTSGVYNYDLTGTFTRNAEQEPRIKCLGNVASAKAKIVSEGNKQWLSFYDIEFKSGDNVNHGGAVVAHVNNGVGQASFVLTIAYDAADAKWGKNADGNMARVASEEEGTEVKRWDFYSGNGDGTDGGWDLGKYGEDDGTRYADNPNGWKAKSKLFKETHKADGLTADWEYDYVDVPNSKEPIFKSIYDMEGDNADMVHETAGLVFFTEPNELGIYNENDAPTSAFQDRFIGLMGGGKLIIPRLKEDDRVVIKMGAFGNVDGVGNSEYEQKAVLNFIGAKDAKGNDITGDYVIGGSMPYNDETSPANMLPHGEYHFMATGPVNNGGPGDPEKPEENNKNGNFILEVKEAALLKIYSIDIYRNAANDNADILTENSITTANGPELLFTDEDEAESEKDMEFYLRYSGFEEPSQFGTFDNNYTRGNLNLSSSSFSDGSKENSLKTTFTKGDFGSFRADAEVYTKEGTKAYVTDYTPGSLAVGNLDKMEYPYTWDFTDLLSIEQLSETDGAYIKNAINTEIGTTNRPADYNGWMKDEGAYCLRNAPENASGVLFANGGQIYGANVNFEEIAGIGFKRSPEAPEYAKLLNTTSSILSASLELNCNEKDMFHKLVLPKVPADAVIYVRAAPIETAKYPMAKFSVDKETGEDFDETLEIKIPGSNTKKDKVFIMKNDTEQDVELWLNGVAVKKIGVSVDFKTIGSTGYATESRERVIDHRLTEFFTGVPIKAYWGELSDDKTKVTLKDVEFLKAATAEGDATGCVLHNETTSDDKAVNIIDGGFHLFVPDMHDKGTTNINGNVLLAHLSDDPIKNGEGTTRFVLSAKYYDGSQVGASQKTYINGKTVAFYKVDPNTGAKGSANSAYLELSSGDAQPALMLRFFEDMFGEVPTTIKAVEPSDEENAVWYNLNGQAINAPQKAGIYIRNGKKVIVK